MGKWYPLAHIFETPPELAEDDTFIEWASRPSWLLEEGVCLALGYKPRNHLNAEPHPKHDDDQHSCAPGANWYTLHRTRIVPVLELYARYAHIPPTTFAPHLICIEPRAFLTFS